MSIKDRLASIYDVFSRRSAARGQGYKPDEIPERWRNRLMLLYGEVLSGHWTDNAWSSPGDHRQEFWLEMHRMLQHLYGRPKLSQAKVGTPIEDTVAFVQSCEPVHLFDFIELTFKTESVQRVLQDENLFR